MTYSQFIKRTRVCDDIIRKMVNLKQKLWDEYYSLNSQEIIAHAEDMVRSTKDKHIIHPL